MTLRGSFIPNVPIALFLDVDGTLLEIAASPESVKVPAALLNTLDLAAQREGGALALITGRCITELDRLFVPYVFAAAGQHGLERRNADGHVTRAPVDKALLAPARSALKAFVEEHAGLLLEDKGSALALHYRAAPLLKMSVQALLEKLLEPLKPHFILRTGKCVFELAPANCSKRIAIEAFMREEPFAGRVPVFVGDDVTDEDGFAAVNALGGYSIRVGCEEPTVATYRFGSVPAVVAWLRERNINRALGNLR
ncbi:MAG: trehalose-phosphatase [Candidatus Obscuribacterales bacterium]|nr:trehalose-phosphatase [Steroidobacteraceae bacterium]